MGVTCAYSDFLCFMGEAERGVTIQSQDSADFFTEENLLNKITEKSIIDFDDTLWTTDDKAMVTIKEGNCEHSVIIKLR